MLSIDDSMRVEALRELYYEREADRLASYDPEAEELEEELRIQAEEAMWEADDWR